MRSPARPTEGPECAGATTEILFDTVGPLGVITLNRPAALNALTLEMIRAFAAKLHEWASAPDIRALVLRGAGDRAFCAGGDIVRIWRAALKGDTSLTDAFFREEYHLDRDLARFPKPQVSILDGIVMGGGVGVSIYGSHRVVTERTVFAMPETAIGFFCDIGASWFLRQFPGRVGLYVALTGARLRAADLLWCGVATHFIPSHRLPEVIPRLARTPLGQGSSEAVSRVLAGLSGPAGATDLEARRGAIDRCFRATAVEEILDNLDREGGVWARETADALRRMSPTSLKAVFRELQGAEGIDLEAALATEFRLSQRFMGCHDFREGVRAALVDRDGRPAWLPTGLEDVSAEAIGKLFLPLAGRELWS